MLIRDAELLYQELAIELELPEYWTLVFDPAKRRAGQCRYSVHEIGLSYYFVTNNVKEQVEQTIRHEIAHALVGPGHGHDEVWLAKARECGFIGNRCYNDPESERTHMHGLVQMPKGKYRFICSIHGEIMDKHRHNAARKYSCSKCSRRYDERFLLTVKIVN